MTSVHSDTAGVEDEPTLQLLDAPPGARASAAGYDDQRTMHAVRLMDFASLFSAQFKGRSYGRERVRRLRLTNPDSPSTAGGKLARRSILFAPDDGGRDVLVIGWVDVASKRAELRTFESLNQYFCERFGAQLDMAIDDYANVLLDTAQFFRAQGIHMSLLPAAARVSTDLVEQGRGPMLPVALFWVVGLLTGVCLGYAAFGH